MEKNQLLYQTYVSILKKELIPAMGCTEPIAVAYCAAKAREALGVKPERILILASGNIIKNVKSVVVPNTGGMKGLETAAAAGALYGNADRKLEVIAGVTKEQQAALATEMKAMEIKVSPLMSSHILDIEITLYAGGHEASARIWDTHTNLVRIVKDGEVLYQAPEYENPQETGQTETKTAEGEVQSKAAGDGTAQAAAKQTDEEPDYNLLTVADIFDFANTVNLADVRETLERQMSYNMTIAEEGMRHVYGAKIGQILAKQSQDIKIQAKAFAAAGSDARMGGCELPVIINSGSGNQGITASVPVMLYARHYQKTEEELLRALAVSNLVTLHLKSGIGRLSAYCGVVSAGVGAGAGIAYLLTKNLRAINHTIVNAVAITSGIVCDGAKASCAAKIAMSVEAGILGFEMYQEGSQLRDGEGLVSKGVENTIRNISQLGHDGMKETDHKIIEIMTGCM